MSRAYSAERIRFVADVGSSSAMMDALTEASPDFYRGMSVSFELVMLYANELVAMADYDSITLVVRDPTDKTGSNLMERTVAFADLNSGLAEADAGALGTDQHAVFRFSLLETLLDLKSQDSRAFWLFIYGNTQTLDQNGATVIGRSPIGFTNLTVRESGQTSDITSSPAIGSSIISVGSTYDGSGNKTQAVTANLIYEWTPNDNDTTLVNGAEILTVAGRFTAAGSSVTLTGDINQLVTATLRQPLFYIAEEIRAMMSGVLKAIGEPGAFIGVRSPNGAWTGLIGISDDGQFIMQPTVTPTTP